MTIPATPLADSLAEHPTRAGGTVRTTVPVGAVFAAGSVLDPAESLVPGRVVLDDLVQIGRAHV